jgi:hypothetical protein
MSLGWVWLCNGIKLYLMGKIKHVLAPPPLRIWSLTSEASTYGHKQSGDVLPLSLALNCCCFINKTKLVFSPDNISWHESG